MIIKNNQSTLDISTQINGDVRSVVDFCIKNNLSLTEDLEIGAEYENPDTEYKNDLVEEFFFSKEKELTTSEPKLEIEPEGIGVMIVEDDFIVR